MEIIIPGAPIAQKRARFSHKSTKVFNPQKNEKSAFRWVIKSKWKYGVIETPVAIEMKFFFPIPPSWSKKKQKQMILQPHINTPDIDNLQVIMLNSMTGIIYKDDRQVYKITASKYYDKKPRSEITICQESYREIDLENGQR